MRRTPALQFAGMLSGRAGLCLVLGLVIGCGGTHSADERASEKSASPAQESVAVVEASLHPWPRIVRRRGR